MRKWQKYIVADDVHRPRNEPISKTFSEHERDMGGYDVTSSYVTKEAFFNEYYFGVQRIENYDLFVRKHLTRDQEILSVGSGRCANELMLMDNGYRVTCSELGDLPAHQATK